MPTPESQAAFTELMEARKRLNDVSRELKEANQLGIINGRYRSIQKQWDDALGELQEATARYSEALRSVQHPPSN